MPFWMWLAACGGVPLPEVPIVGGSELQREAVRDELEAFEHWVTPGRIKIAKVKFKDVSWDGADYDHSRVIYLDLDLSPAIIRNSLRHELCHATDYQNGMLDRPEEDFDIRVNILRTESSLPLYDKLPDRERQARGEVMAYICEEGPSAALLMSTGCTPGSDSLRDLGDWLRDQVWHGPQELDETSAWGVSAVQGSWSPRVDTDIDRLDVVGSRSRDAAQLHFGRRGVWYEAALDLRSSEELATGLSDTNEDSIHAPIPILPAGLRVPGPIALDATGIRHVTDGVTAVALAQGHLLENFGTVLSQRILVHDGGDRWSIAGGSCLPDAPASVFLANGRFYVAWVEDDEIRWSEIVRTDDP